MTVNIIDIEIAKQIGRKKAYIFVSIGLLIAEIIMSYFGGGTDLFSTFFWFWDLNYKLNLFVGVLLMYVFSYYFGGLAGISIIIKLKNENWIGILYGFIILMLSTFFASWIGFFQEGINNGITYDNPFVDYICKPVFWVAIFGLLPVIFVGAWYGYAIFQVGAKLKKKQKSPISQ